MRRELTRCRDLRGFGLFAGFLRNAFTGVTPSQARFDATTRVIFVRYVPIDAGLVKVMLPAVVVPAARA